MFDELKVTKDAVLKAAEGCPDAAKVLKTLFPEVFTTCIRIFGRDVPAEPLFRDKRIVPVDRAYTLVGDDFYSRAIWLNGILRPRLFREAAAVSGYTVTLDGLPDDGLCLCGSRLYTPEHPLYDTVQFRVLGPYRGKALWIQKSANPHLEELGDGNWLIAFDGLWLTY